MTTLNKFALLCIAGGLFATAGAAVAGELSPLESLGKSIFFDSALSTPAGQSCATCHNPATGWTGPDSAVNASKTINEGALPGRHGNRKPPTSAYAGFNPLLHKCGDMTGAGMTGAGMTGGGMGGGGMGGGGMGGGGMGGGMMCSSGEFVGGLFYDGRATGWALGDPLAEQAMGPFLNPLEQNNLNPEYVCLQVLKSDYKAAFENVWGQGTLDCVQNAAGAYERIGRSLAAYERSAEKNPFSSKFDNFWRNSIGKMPPVQAINMMNWSKFKNRGLDDSELQGLMIFNTKGKCSTCHTLSPMNGSQYPLFTDFRYHNLGVPKNPKNPFYSMPLEWNPDGNSWIDTGLGGFLARTQGMVDLNGNPRDYVQEAAMNYGKHKTPTLRNVDKRPTQNFVKAYGHNGYFKSLQEIVHFYNLRDVLPVCNGAYSEKDIMGAVTCFPSAEVSTNINRSDLGNLGLTQSEGMATIKFLQTLTDVIKLSPDFNQDGKVDNTDYAILLAEIRKPMPRNPAFDLNQDGKVDLLDARFFNNVVKGI